MPENVRPEPISEIAAILAKGFPAIPEIPPVPGRLTRRRMTLLPRPNRAVM